MPRLAAALVVLTASVVVRAGTSLALEPLGGAYAGHPEPAPRAAAGGVVAALLHATERHGELEDWQVAFEIAGHWYAGEVPACQGRGCWLEPVGITSAALGGRARLWRFRFRHGEDAHVGGFHTEERGVAELICVTAPDHVPSCLDDTIPLSATSHGEGDGDTLSADVALAARSVVLKADTLQLEIVARRARVQGTAIEAEAWRARLRRLAGRHQLAIP